MRKTLLSIVLLFSGIVNSESFSFCNGKLISSNNCSIEKINRKLRKKHTNKEVENWIKQIEARKHTIKTAAQVKQEKLEQKKIELKKRLDMQISIRRNKQTKTTMTSTIKGKIREFANRKYPNDIKMQQYTYKNQMTAYHYLLTIKDLELKEFASRKYPFDFEMQKYTYDNQLAAKRYIQMVRDTEVKGFSARKYPYDYTMQKYTYDNQLSAKRYMNSIKNQWANNKAVRKYPYDYTMQKYTYDKLAY
jgi:hypothetical protein